MNEIIKKYGRNDGLDDLRLDEAIFMAGEEQDLVWFYFTKILAFEDAGSLPLN